MRNVMLRRVLHAMSHSVPDLNYNFHQYCLSLYDASHAHKIEAEWGSRSPIISLSASLIARGEVALRSLGIPNGAWFVCVHSREGGFLPEEEWAANFRNTDILTYVPAMKRIVERGGWCVRVGDPTMKPLPPIPGVIDYARSSAKSDWMDLFLCANCRFFLGNTSGLFGLAGIFGRPSALANNTPFSSLYSQFPQDISIPKLLQSADGRVFSFDEIFHNEISRYRLAPQFNSRELKHIDNTPEEITALAEEMMVRLDAGGVVPPDHPLQAQLRAMLEPDHYCWHSKAQVGLAFIKAHRDLMPAAPESACQVVH